MVVKIKEKLVGLFNSLIAPKSANLELARREFILNVLLLGASFLVFIAFLNNFFAYFFHLQSQGAVSPLITFAVFLLLVFLLRVSRRWNFTAAAHFLITIFLVCATYTAVKWGVDVPQAELTFALIIVMSGILTTPKFTFVFSALVAILLLSISFLHLNSFYIPDHSWRNQPNTFGDTFLLIATLMVMMIVTWLFNFQIRKAFEKVRASEKALRKERDLLEVKVEERTRELKEAQLEKMVQIYRFAEFGRLASGLFHDLTNPINLVSLNLENIDGKKASLTKGDLAKAEVSITRAKDGMKRLERFVNTARKQLQNQEIQKEFLLSGEIKDVINMFSHKSKERGVTINFIAPVEISFYGNPLRFTQLLTNLLSNAIDSYEDFTPKRKSEVEVKLEKLDKIARLTITDYGRGIPVKNIAKIYEPFFTTKSINKGIGIGLSICKDIIEKDFGGQISVQSKEDKGSCFTIELPIREV